MLIVRVEVPAPFATVVGFSAHVGTGVPLPVTEHVRPTLGAKPLDGTTVIVVVAPPPGETLAGDIGPTEMLKSCPPGITLIVSCTLVLWLRAPDVPVTTTLKIPFGVVGDVLIVRTDVPGTEPGFAVPGANAQVTPVGKLEALHARSTAPVN